jgi:hypothetical protein
MITFIKIRPKCKIEVFYITYLYNYDLEIKKS